MGVSYQKIKFEAAAEKLVGDMLLSKKVYFL